MSARYWSFVLSWSRVGINAAVFLAATRVLTLAEIGLFATAFAPVKLIQSVQKAGISDAVVMFGNRGSRWASLTLVSVMFGGTAAVTFAVLGAMFSPFLLMLSLVPFFNGLGAVPEGILRHRLNMKALALRTFIAQSVAAILTLVMLWGGLGPWALVGFALASAALTNVLSILLARWSPPLWPSWRHVTLILPKTAQIAGRVALNTGQFPLAQLAVGLALGPSAAGAFQIAARMFDLIDALTLSPLRFIALPKLAQSRDLVTSLREQTDESARLAVWIWCGVGMATLSILTFAIGPDHAPHVAPVLQALVPLGLTSAVIMPVTQAITAKRHTGLILRRAVLVLLASCIMLGPALSVSPAACALVISSAGVGGHIWLLGRALPRLGLHLADLAAVSPASAAGCAMTVVLCAAPPLSLGAQIVIGTIVYGATLALFRRPKWRLA